MELIGVLPAFLLAVVLISLTPGPAVALIIQRAGLQGRRAALAVIVGLEFGLYAWALLVASGVAVVAASEIGFVVLKVAGCAVLAWFAYRSFAAWWMLRRSPASQSPQQIATPRRRGTLWHIGEGAVVQLANPKAAIFLLALYPQFVPPQLPLFATTAALGVIQVAIETAIYVAMALIAHRFSHLLRRSTVRRRFEAISGAVMLGLGLRLATTTR